MLRADAIHIAKLHYRFLENINGILQTFLPTFPDYTLHPDPGAGLSGKDSIEVGTVRLWARRQGVCTQLVSLPTLHSGSPQQVEHSWEGRGAL